MATPPRTIERLPAQRVGELPELELALGVAIDNLKLAGAYAADGADRTAAERLERARVAVASVLEELNTFRAPAPPAKRTTTTPTPEPE